MMYSVELLENNRVFIQPVKDRLKHGAKGRVIFECSFNAAKQIQDENSQI